LSIIGAGAITSERRHGIVGVINPTMPPEAR
jgi:hypothetical protein